jgi:acyl-CoA thioesterase FadM
MQTKIYLRDTDATGVLYFTEMLRLALQALEEKFSIRDLVSKHDFLMPIVHAEADYFAPLRVGDLVEVAITSVVYGTTSLSIEYAIHNLDQGIKSGQVKIIHVAVSKKTGEAIPLPVQIKSLI